MVDAVVANLVLLIQEILHHPSPSQGNAGGTNHTPTPDFEAGGGGGAGGCWNTWWSG